MFKAIIGAAYVALGHAVYYDVTNQMIHGPANAPCWNTGPENKK